MNAIMFVIVFLVRRCGDCWRGIKMFHLSKAMLRDEIAKAIWLAEYRRATGKERSITWYDVAEDDRNKYLYLADAVLDIINA
jgi:hypothetical protein